MRKNIRLILHNIRSAHNVGAILRTADAAGVQHVYLCGYTPAPKDRFGRKRQDIAKTAIGAEEFVSWSTHTCTLSLIAELKKQYVTPVAVEQDARSVPYTSFSPSRDTAFLLGSEVGGIEPDILAVCDSIVEIPMRGRKESLNVSVAAGIILFCCDVT